MPARTETGAAHRSLPATISLNRVCLEDRPGATISFTGHDAQPKTGTTPAPPKATVTDSHPPQQGGSSMTHTLLLSGKGETLTPRLCRQGREATGPKQARGQICRHNPDLGISNQRCHRNNPQIARGFRNFTNYRMRCLLAAGAHRPPAGPKRPTMPKCEGPAKPPISRVHNVRGNYN